MVGNAADVRAVVITSAAAGTAVAATVNADLVADDVARGAVARATAASAVAHLTRSRPQASRLRRTALTSAPPRARSGAAGPIRSWSPRPPSLPPGRALDVGSGEGADAALARPSAAGGSPRWTSPPPRWRGAPTTPRPLGGEVADRIEWMHADLPGWHPAEGRYDLVSAQFMHLPPEQRRQLFARLADAVAPGGGC